LQTEHLWTLYRNHGNLNKLLQTSTVALHHLQQESKAKGMGEIFKNSVKELKEPWGESPPVQVIDDDFLHAAISNIAELSVVRIHSAIEEYLTNLNSDDLRWNRFNRLSNEKDTTFKKENDVEDSDEEEIKGLAKVCRNLKLESELIQRYLAIDTYFTYMRNCIAHRRSSISKGLSDYSKSDSFTAAINFVNKERKKGKAPELPELIHREKLRLKPRVPIFYSAIAKIICDQIDSAYLGGFGEDGAIYLAAHKTLIGRGVQRLEKSYQAFERPICDYLSEKYRKYDVNGKQVKSTLKKLGLLDLCEDRFKQLVKAQSSNI
jgi:hypothetical protein